MTAPASSKIANVLVRGFLFFFGLPFVAGGLFGVFLLQQAFHKPDAGLKDFLLPAILAVVFLAGGGLMWYVAIVGTSTPAALRRLQEAAPGQPWRWREDWARGQASGQVRKEQKFLWVFAIFWNLISMPLLFVLPGQIVHQPVAAFGFLFPAIGIGMLVWAVRGSMRARRFGATVLELGTQPAQPGGQFSGTIRARFPVAPAQGVKVQLTCLRRSYSGAGKNRQKREDIVWREERLLGPGEVLVAGGEASIPVRFALPADALETEAVSSYESGIFWSVGAEASLPGIDYLDDFEIPVYRSGAAPLTAPTGEPSPAEPVVTPVFATDRSSAATVSLEDLARSGITIVPGPEGTEYHFAAARNRSFSLGTAGFFILWTGMLVVMTKFGAPGFFIFVFGLFDLLMLVIVADLLFGVTRLTVGGGSLIRLYSMFGLSRQTSIPCENISKLDLHISMQTSGRRGTPYYALRATFINGRTRDLVSGIRDKHQAEWLAAELRRAIGLPRG